MADSGRNLIWLAPSVYTRLLRPLRWQRAPLFALLALLVLAGYAGLFVPAACAQNANSASSTANAGQPSFRVFVLGPVRSVLYDVSRNQPRQVSFSRSSYSREHPLPANGDLRFYRMRESAEGLPPERVEVATIRVGTRSVDEPVIIVLSPNPNYRGQPAAEQHSGAGVSSAAAEPEFFSRILDGSFSAHPQETIRVVSYARRNVALKLGDEQLLLSPDNPDGIIRYPQGDRAIMQVGAVLGGVWTPVYSSQQMFSPQTRLTLFIADQPRPAGMSEAEGITMEKIVEFFR